MQNLKWIQNWYSKQIDGDWEHTFGIKIETLDNPGWLVEIDLAETDYEHLVLDYKLIENSETDWFATSIVDQKFKGAGDVNKLDLLLNYFRELIENKEKV